MGSCWTQRGCDREMSGSCPHAVTSWDMCPSRCMFSKCNRPTHLETYDPAVLFDPTVDRMKAVKEVCTMCAHFLANGPRCDTEVTD